ncbi:MAG: FAD-dependent oxidoreductase [Acholeplasmataceae bacterium]|jgi:thioredoxin reductase (NADPH)|nr:FAD-dependent oxidoreductase [Acholeplasmataceae bacterium]
MYDVVVIGAGPAGITAGIYAKRANLNVVIIEKNAPGGQMINTGEIENYPGYAKIGGADLSMEMFNHSLSLNLEYIFGEVKEIKDGHIKEVILNNQVLKTKSIIIATGAVPRRLGIENEDMLAGRGISWCAICDGPFYKGKDVIIVGGGNSAVEEGTYLSTLANSVIFVQNLAEFTADKKAVEILLKRDNVKVFYNSVVKRFLVNEDSTFKGAEILINDKEVKTLLADGAFIFIGLEPATKLFEDLGILDKYKYIITNELMETNKEGIYAIGDVRKKQIRQIVTATNDGAIAVQNLLNYLKKWT